MNIMVGTTDDNREFMGLVLEPGNIHRMKQGQRVAVRIEDFFPDGIPKQLELGIFYSDTPVADAQAISKMSKATFDERAPAIRARRPHCPECRSTIEQMGMMRPDEGPVVLMFCPVCGCTLGTASK